MSANACYDAMLRLGVATATAHFSGGNDEGGFDENVVFTAIGEDAVVPEKLAGFDVYDESGRTRWNPAARRYEEVGREDPDKAAIAKHLASVLDGEYGGFGGDFSVYGNVIVDATTRTTKISGEESTYRPFTRSL